MHNAHCTLYNVYCMLNSYFNAIILRPIIGSRVETQVYFLISPLITASLSSK